MRHRPENEDILQANNRILSLPQGELGQALTDVYTSLAPNDLRQQASTNLQSSSQGLSDLIYGDNFSKLCEIINYSNKAMEELRLPPEEVFAKPFFKDDYLAEKKEQFIKKQLPYNDCYEREGLVRIAKFARDPLFKEEEILNPIVRASCLKPPNDELMNTSRN